MKPKEVVLYPRADKVLEELGENIRMARLRRKLSTGQISERAGISRPTLNAIENGMPTVSIGAYIKVLAVLGLEKDISLVAKDDILGRKLQDAGLTVRKRAPKRKK